MNNTRNDVETLATAELVTLAGSALGNDTNAIEAIATAQAVTLTVRGNDDNMLAELTAALV